MGRMMTVLSRRGARRIEVRAILADTEGAAILGSIAVAVTVSR